MTAGDSPFKVKTLDDDVVITFAQYVDHERTPDHDRELEDLVGRHKLVVCDLSGSRKVTSDWLRFLLRLTVKATKMGKRVAIVGMRDNVRQTSDVLGLLGALDLCRTLDEARG